MNVDYLAFHRQVEHFYLAYFSEIRVEYDAAQSEIELLLYLGGCPEKDTASGFVHAYKLSKSQVSMAVEQLVKKELLLRTQDLRNRRIIHLQLSAQGRVFSRQLAEKREAFWGALLKKLSPAERIHLLETLNEIYFSLPHTP